MATCLQWISVLGILIISVEFGGCANFSKTQDNIDISTDSNTTVLPEFSSTIKIVTSGSTKYFKRLAVHTVRTSIRTTRTSTKTTHVTSGGKRKSLTTHSNAKPSSNTKLVGRESQHKNNSYHVLNRFGKQALQNSTEDESNINSINTAENNTEKDDEDYVIVMVSNSTSVSSKRIQNSNDANISNEIDISSNNIPPITNISNEKLKEASEKLNINEEKSTATTSLSSDRSGNNSTNNSQDHITLSTSTDNQIEVATTLPAYTKDIELTLTNPSSIEINSPTTSEIIQENETDILSTEKVSTLDDTDLSIETTIKISTQNPVTTEEITKSRTTPAPSTESTTEVTELIQSTTTTIQSPVTVLVTKETPTTTVTTPRSTTPESHPGKYKLACFYSSWSVYRQQEECKMTPDKINPHLCTHLIYAFAQIANNKLIPTDAALDLDEEANFDSYGKDGNYRKFTKLKSENANLKTMLSVGGYTMNSSVFSEMASSSSSRETFITSVLQLLRKYNFDGLDICWQYPTFPGGAPEDWDNFPLLLKELRNAFDKEATDNGKNKLLLSIAVAASAYYISKAYKIDAINDHVDFINIMTYNYHGPTWDSHIGHNSPLYKSSKDLPGQENLNVVWSMNEWHNSGAAAYKLLMGIAFFGNAYTLQDTTKHDIGSPHSKEARQGSCTRQPGILAYNEFCSIKTSQQWTIIRNNETKVPYAFSSEQWIGYDDEESIEEKAKYITQNKFGGAFVWTIDYDDFSGRCGSEKYPMLTILKRKLQDGGQLE